MGRPRAPARTSPSMEGLGITACSLECLACLNHVHGWTIWGGYGTCLSTPLSRSIGSLASCSATGPFDLGDLGIIEQQLNQCSNQLWFPSLCPVVMHSPVTGLFRVLLDRFLLPTIRPRFPRATYDSHTNRLSIQHCNVWSDGLLR